MSTLLKKIAVIIIAGLVCGACWPIDGHYYLTLVNTSGRDIVYSWRGFLENDPMTDTLYDYETMYYFIPAGASKKDESSSYSWEIDFKRYPHVQYLIMDAELFKAYIDAPLDTFRKYVPVLHRFLLTQQDVERMNWVVVYPPLAE